VVVRIMDGEAATIRSGATALIGETFRNMVIATCGMQPLSPHAALPTSHHWGPPECSLHLTAS
jgi:hypothetical protein